MTCLETGKCPRLAGPMWRPLVVVLLPVLIVLSCTPPAVKEWDGETTLPGPEHLGWRHNITAAGDTVLVVGWGAGIGIARSLDGGESWSYARIPDTGGDSIICPALAVSGSHVYVAAMLLSSGAIHPRVLFWSSTDGGTTWGACDTIAAEAADYYVDVAAAGPSVFVAWSEDRVNACVVRCRRSTDFGRTWESSIDITNGAWRAGETMLAISGQDVHLVCVCTTDSGSDRHVYYSHSGDAGLNWDPQVLISESETNQRCPAVSASGTTVCAIWWYEYPPGAQATASAGTGYCVSRNSGASWGAPRRFAYNTPSVEDPTVLVHGADIYAVMASDTGNGHQRCFLSSSDYGAHWSGKFELSPYIVEGQRRLPGIAVGNGRIHVVYSDCTSKTYYRRGFLD